jgi:spermidine synthase
VILYLLAIGFVSILGQVVVLRELNVAFYGVELIYILAIGVWLLSTAIGALIGRRAYVPSVVTVKYLFVAFALLLPADVAFIRYVRILFGGIPGSYLPFGLQLIAIAIALLPLGILLGLLFQWAAKLYIGKERTLALAYAIESAGGLLGGLSSTILLKVGIQNFTITILCGLSAVIILLFPFRAFRSRVGYVATFVSIALLTVLIQSGQLDRGMTRATHATLVDTGDSPYSRITVTRQADQIVVFENDALAFETQSTAAEELVHLAAIQRNPPKDVLILGGGLDGTILEVLKYSPEKIDYVELKPLLLRMAEEHLPDEYRAILASDVVTVHLADPRRFVADADTYDLILVGMPDPTSGQANRFHTREFFEQCAHILNPDGVLAFRLRSSENIWTQFVTYRNTSIHRALDDAFRDVVLLPGVSNVVIASHRLLERHPSVLAETFTSRNIPTRLVTPEYIDYLYNNDRFFEIAARLESATVPPNTDVRPVCYRYSTMIWLSKFIPTMINWDIGISDRNMRDRAPWYGGIFIVICGLFLMARRRARLRRAFLVGVAGFIGMVVETIFILHYQVKTGVLFQNIGILLMAFMAGLAVGSWAVLKTARTPSSGLATINRTAGYGLLAGFVILNLIFIGLLNTGYSSDLFTMSLFMFLAGFLVSGVLAYASLAGVSEQKIVVSPLYAADLLGGCVGSLLASLFFIPFLGMAESAALMAVLAVLAMLLI